MLLFYTNHRNLIELFCLIFSFEVCLKNLNDHGNAFLAFERSAMLSDAVKNPLIYLNFTIYSVQMKRFELAALNLNHFFSVAEHTSVRHEVSLI